MMLQRISGKITDSKIIINKNERGKEKGDTDGPSGRPVVEISIENSP